MVSVVDAVGLVVILGANTAVSALLTRLFRVRLNTKWGSVLYSVLLIPLVLLVVVLLLGGAGLGPDLGATTTVLGVTILLPMAVGMTVDYFWQPAPDEVNLPEKYESG